MPYIEQSMRENTNHETVGELNFGITELCKKYLDRNGLNYKTLNDVIGVLECAKLEFYRRIASPYENMKMIQNGDVYTSEK